MLEMFRWQPEKHELRHLTWDQVGLLLSEAGNRIPRKTRFACYAMMACPLPLAYVAGPLVVEMLGDTPAAWLGIVYLPIALVVTFLPLRWLHVAHKRSLNDLLVERDLRPQFCVGCGYDLRGTPGLSCPECGLELAAQAVSREIEAQAHGHLSAGSVRIE